MVVQIELVLDKRLSVSVDTQMHRDLKVCAALHGVSMNTVVVNAVNEYLRRCCKSGDEKDK